MKRRNREVKVQTAMGRDSAGKASSSDVAESRSVESIIFGDPVTAEDILGDKATDPAPSSSASAVDSDVAAAAASADKPDYGDIPDFAAPEGTTTKPADPGFMSGTSAYRAYGEPIAVETPEEFSELEAMEELLAGTSEVGQLPLPEVFNAYPPEVQRKIMEWTDRDVRARRDDESRRKDELVRAQIERERRKQSIPAIIIVVSILCGTVLGFVTRSAWLAAAFLIVPIAVIVANFASGNIADNRNDRYRKPPQA